ncbi:MAG: hypothetical protein LC685_00605 [Actinobacteria bacterium]|nr:hypothetical protein [Actinomycetota bacterium]
MLEQRAQGACAKKKPAPQGGGNGTSGGSSGASGTGGGSSGSGTPATGSTGSTAPGAATQTPGPDGIQTPAPLISNDAVPAAARTAREGETPPFPLLALAALLALMALGTIAWGVLRFTGWEPAWAPRARHAAAEAGWRASSTWAEFTDFVRFGR